MMIGGDHSVMNVDGKLLIVNVIKEHSMPYTKPHTYKSSRYLSDEILMDIINGILGLETGQTLAINFGSTRAQESTRNKLYSILNGLERKEDFVIKKRNNVILEVTNVIVEEVVVSMKILDNKEDTE